MAKASSPVRLQSELMESARIVGAQHHRSASEQVEYWAAIGRAVQGVVDPDTLVSLTCGLVRLNVEPVVSEPADPMAVFDSLEQDRANGRLADQVVGKSVHYQASKDFPGYLEQLSPAGEVTVGQFIQGEFHPLGDFSA